MRGASDALQHSSEQCLVWFDKLEPKNEDNFYGWVHFWVVVCTPVCNIRQMYCGV